MVQLIKAQSSILFNQLTCYVDQLTFQRSNMEITFMPRRRVHSVNFLERFKGKFSRVSRIGGIQEILDGHPYRYDTLEDNRVISKQSNNKTNDYNSSNSRSKRNTYLSIDVHHKQKNTGGQLARKRGSALCKPKQVNISIDDKENLDESNLLKSELFLPRLNPKSIANSKCPNRIKSRILTRKQRKATQETMISTRVVYKHNLSKNLGQCV